MYKKKISPAKAQRRKALPRFLASYGFSLREGYLPQRRSGATEIIQPLSLRRCAVARKSFGERCHMLLLILQEMSHQASDFLLDTGAAPSLLRSAAW